MAKKPRDGSLTWERSLCKNPSYAKQLLASLTEQASKGDEFAAEQIAKILADYPELKSAVREIDDLTSKVETAWTKALADGDELASEAIRKEIAALKSNLIGPNAGLMQRTLVGVYVVSYMAHQRAASLAAQPAPNSAVAAARERSLEGAQRRLTAAIKNMELIARKAGQGLTVPPGIRLFDAAPTRRRRRKINGVARRLEQ